jgi:hypothetical protein
MLAAFGFALFCMFALPTFAGSDEAAHYSYALEVGHGRLPTIDTPMPTGDSTQLRRWLSLSNTPDRRRTIWVANHPPLYYALAAPVVKIAEAVDGETNGFRSMRLLSSLFITASVAATALFAREAFGGNGVLVVAAAGMTAALPHVTGAGGLAYNDALGFLLTAAALAIAARIVRRGPTWPRIAGAAAVVSAAALTRAELLLLAPMMLAAFGASIYARSDRPRRRVLVGQLACVAAVPVVASAWFYLRNLDRYGSWTGSEYLLHRFHRSPQLGSVFDVLWKDQLLGRISANLFTSTPTLTGTFRTEGIFGGSWLSPNWRSGFPVVGVVLGLALLGALRAGVHRLRTRVTPSREEKRWLGFVAVLLGYCVLVCVAVTQSVAAGHTPWARYLFPVVPVMVLGAVWGLHRLLSSRWLLVAVIAMMFSVEAVVLFSLVPEHYLYPFFGMGAPGISVAGKNVARVLAVIGAIVAVTAIAWPARTGAETTAIGRIRARGVPSG